MLDLKNAEFLKLHKVSDEAFAGDLHSMLIPGEQIITSCQSVRSGIVLTTKRMFFVEITGMSGRRIDITSLPYRNIRIFSHLRTALNVDREIGLSLVGGGFIKLNFTSDVDTDWICRLLGRYIL